MPASSSSLRTVAAIAGETGGPFSSLIRSTLLIPARWASAEAESCKAARAIRIWTGAIDPSGGRRSGRIWSRPPASQGEHFGWASAPKKPQRSQVARIPRQGQGTALARCHGQISLQGVGWNDPGQSKTPCRFPSCRNLRFEIMDDVNGLFRAAGEGTSRGPQKKEPP